MNAVDYQTQFDRAREDLAGAGTAWLDSLRERALAQFARDGFPTPRVEEWKYANLGNLASTPLAFAGSGTGDLVRVLDDLVLPAESHRLVLVNGRFRPELSVLGDLPKGVAVDSLADLLTREPDALAESVADPGTLAEDRLSGRRDPRPFAMVAMNTAFAQDGIVIRLARGAAAELPIHVIHLAAAEDDAAMIQPRSLILAEAGSSALVVETFASSNDRSYLTNAVMEVRAAPDAHIRHYRVQEEGPTAWHLSTVLARLDKAAAYDSFVLSTGAGFSRNEIRVALDGEHVHCRLNGAYLGRHKQHMDNWTRIDLAKPNGTVTETYRSVLADASRGAFQGKVRVWEQAMKADAHQLNNNLLLSPDAQADSKPELEILADDVRCSHGSTVGDIDEDALFYLRTRGIDADSARNLLIDAFVGDIIDHIGYGTAHDYLRARFDRWLAAYAAEGA